MYTIVRVAQEAGYGRWGDVRLGRGSELLHDDGIHLTYAGCARARRYGFPQCCHDCVF
jgi:hypothetical protein